MDKIVKQAASPRPKTKKVREPGYIRLAQSIRDEIFDGRIAAGERLKVSDIARRYGTSTNPAREALQALEGEGLVTITPNRGASVREINEDMLQNVFELRTLLWIYVLKTFVEFATQDEAAELRRHQVECAAAAEIGDYPAYHKANILFHDLIVDHHFNTEAVAIIRKHNGWMKAFSKSEPLSNAQMRRSVAEHWRIVNAVEKGDVQEAADAIEQHLQNAQTSFLERLRRKRLNAGT